MKAKSSNHDKLVNVLLVVFLLIIVTFACWSGVISAGASVEYPASIPQPPDGCVVKNYIDWHDTVVVGGWGGHDIDRPYDTYCGVGIKVGDVWHVSTSWNTTQSFPDGSSIKLFINAQGVKGFETLAPNPKAGGHLDGGIVWDKIPMFPSSDDIYNMFTPMIMNDWGVCDGGCVGPPPIPPPLP